MKYVVVISFMIVSMPKLFCQTLNGRPVMFTGSQPRNKENYDKLFSIDF